MFILCNFFRASEWDYKFGEALRLTANTTATMPLYSLSPQESITQAQSFASELFSRLKREYEGNKKYAFSLEFDDDELYRAGGREYAYNRINDKIFKAFAEKIITRARVSAYILGKQYLANFIGSLETDSNTSATGTSESASTGTNAQKFNNGVNTSSTGTANKTETSDTATGITTGATTGKTITQYAREYDGNLTELLKANAGADAVTLALADFKNAFMRAADLYPWEIADAAKIL